MDQHQVVKAGLDLSALSALVGWWAGIAPAVATTLTVIWVGFCICEAIYLYYNKYKNRNK